MVLLIYLKREAKRNHVELNSHLHLHMVNRRFFLVKCLKVTAYTSFLGMLSQVMGTTPLKAQRWQDEMLKDDGSDGEASIVFLSGKATNRGAKLQTDDKITEKATITTSSKGWLILSLTDGSLLRINQNSTVSLLQTAKNGTLINLKRGSILLIINQAYAGFYPYLVHTKNADYGIRDAVFYCRANVLDESQAVDENLLGDDVQTKENKDYTCLCHGTVDFFTPDLKRTFQILNGNYHNSFFMHGSGIYKKAELLDHDDKMISETASFFRNGVNDLWWLRKKVSE
ncbi:MAG: FecR domain-containing protein [SAR324 cluster bacterium]|nr:FecR domain-containing protein [SAR324 cluster bacterium]